MQYTLQSNGLTESLGSSLPRGSQKNEFDTFNSFLIVWSLDTTPSTINVVKVITICLSENHPSSREIQVPGSRFFSVWLWAIELLALRLAYVERRQIDVEQIERYCLVAPFLFVGLILSGQRLAFAYDPSLTTDFTCRDFEPANLSDNCVKQFLGVTGLGVSSVF